MKKLVYDFISILILFLAGRFVPALFISSGVENFSGDEKLVARDAILEANFLTRKIERILVSAKKVTNISDDSSCKIVNVKLYTLFGLPYGNVKVGCEDASIERF